MHRQNHIKFADLYISKIFTIVIISNVIYTVHAHLRQNVLYCYTFVYTCLVMTLYRSKHVDGTSVANDYLLLFVQFIGSNAV